MKSAIIFVLSALLGIASCDTVCMQFKFPKCLAIGGYPQDEFCMSTDIECIKKATRECDIENEPIVTEIVTRYTETCTEGTEMNKLFQKHKTCVFEDSALGTAACILPVVRAALSAGFPSRTRNYQERVLKAICKVSGTGEKCINDNINSTCGAEAAYFRYQLSDPAIRLTERACDEVDAETNEIHYSLQQHHEHSVQMMAPYTQHLAAAGPHAGSIHIASTIAPRKLLEPMNAATINMSSHFIYVLLSTLFIKWLSPY